MFSEMFSGILSDMLRDNTRTSQSEPQCSITYSPRFLSKPTSICDHVDEAETLAAQVSES